MTFADRDHDPVEALLVDRYLEALLAASDRGATDAPHDDALDPVIGAAARRLRDELVRVHPSFRFEERLARRLAEFAAHRALAAAAGAEGTVIPFPGFGHAHARSPADGPARPGWPDAEADALAAIAAGRLDPAALAANPSRPILLGGAMASAMLSLAGVVFVAWRATRPQPPMRRAVRAIQRARPRPGVSRSAQPGRGRLA